MTDPNVTIVCDLRCLHLPRLLENYARAAEPLPTSDGDLEHLFHITSIEGLQALTIDDIKKEIQMIMWAHYEVDVCRKDFVLLLDTVRTAANDDSKNQLVKVDHCDSVATVLRQWEMPCGTAAEGVRIRFDPCWKNYVQLTSCTWRPFARPLRHQWKSLRAWPAIKGGCWWHYIELMSCVAGLDVCRFTEFDFSYMVVYCVCVCLLCLSCACVCCVCCLCVWLSRVVCDVCVCICVGLVCCATDVLTLVCLCIKVLPTHAHIHNHIKHSLYSTVFNASHYGEDMQRALATLVYKNIRCKSSPYIAHINNHIKHVFNAFGISGV